MAWYVEDGQLFAIARIYLCRRVQTASISENPGKVILILNFLILADLAETVIII